MVENRMYYKIEELKTLGRSKTESDDFALIVDGNVKFEAKEPTHRTFASLGKLFENLIRANTTVITYIKRCRI